MCQINEGDRLSYSLLVLPLCVCVAAASDQRQTDRPFATLINYEYVK